LNSSEVSTMPIAVEFEWVTPLMIAIALCGSALIIICPRRMRAQAAFDEANPPVDEAAPPAEGEPEPTTLDEP
jgi:hypothetical protein